MNDAEQEAVKCGFEQIELTVSPDNHNAVKFYENLDWKKLPRTRNGKAIWSKP